MAEAKESKVSEAEYLEMERLSDVKHEYLAGEIFAHAGASAAHNTISSNIIAELRNQLRNKSCWIFGSDMKVKIEKANKYSYPDVSVVCGERTFLDDRKDVLLNPQLIIEILSDSTEAYDRGKKFKQYRMLDSLKDYVLVSQSEMKIEVFFKDERGKWILSETDDQNQSIFLESIACSLSIADVYEKAFEAQ